MTLVVSRFRSAVAGEYGVTVRDRGVGGISEGRPIYTLGCEPALVPRRTLATPQTGGWGLPLNRVRHVPSNRRSARSARVLAEMFAQLDFQAGLQDLTDKVGQQTALARELDTLIAGSGLQLLGPITHHRSVAHCRRARLAYRHQLTRTHLSRTLAADVATEPDREAPEAGIRRSGTPVVEGRSGKQPWLSLGSLSQFGTGDGRSMDGDAVSAQPTLIWES